MSVAPFGPSFWRVVQKKKVHYFMQGGAKQHTAKYSINVLDEVLEDILIGSRLWPVTSPDLFHSDVYLWGNLKGKKSP
jgi:hypothetical protein